MAGSGQKSGIIPTKQSMKAVLLLADFAMAAIFVIAVNWLALIPFRRSKGKHWTERARVLYPASVAARSKALTVPAIVALGQRLLLDDDVPHWLPSGLAAWLGVIAGTYFFVRESMPSATPR